MQIGSSQHLPDKPDIESRTLYSKHITVLLLGATLGLSISYWACGISFDFSHEIEQARSLGIVSRTILNGYPISLNLLNYTIVLGIPVLFAISLWLCWSRGKKKDLFYILKPINHPPYIHGQNKNLSLLLPIVVSGLLLTFNINYFYGPTYSGVVKSWLFLGEEGEMLEWAYRVINGDVFGKDFFCLYGPMQIYPLAWFIDFWGMNVFNARVLAYLYNLASMGIVIFFLYKTVKSKLVFSLSCFACIFILNTMVLAPSPNTTLLRSTLGLLPLLLIYLYGRKTNKAAIISAGLISGQSLLFSQEFGLCGFLTIFLFFLVEALFDKNYKRTVYKGGIFLGSFCISLFPCLFYLANNDALGAFWSSMYGYPKLVTLGFGGLPFPPFRAFLLAPLTGGMYLPYWTIFLYVFSAIYIFTRHFIGLTDNHVKLKFLLTIYGILVFRVALGRYAESNVIKAITPALLLCFLYIDDSWAVLKSKAALHSRLGNITLFSTMVIPLALLFAYSPHINYKSSWALSDILSPSGKFAINHNGVDLPEIKRAGIFIDSRTSEDIKGIHKFLSANTASKDYVYFFPNAPMYYFLFDRRNPTRFGLSYTAISRHQRLEVVNDLEKNKPEFVIYNLNTWRIDNIPESVQVPEIVSYLHEKYKIIHRGPNLLFMARND